MILYTKFNLKKLPYFSYVISIDTNHMYSITTNQ